MMTWTLLYKLFNNKHTIKIVKIQMFRLRRRKNQLPSGNPVLLDAANGGKERKSTTPVQTRPYM